MKRGLYRTLLLWLWLAAVAPMAGAAPGLDGALDRALDARALRGARVGALVVARDGGRVLYERNADAALVPASNQKLLTAVAALAAFGPSHHFPLDIYTSEPLDASGSVGTLFVRASGDPALTSEDLWRLAADLRILGLRAVRDGIVIDDAAFDSERWHPSWGPVSARAYHAPVGAFNANYGAFAVEVQPGREPGDPVRVRVDPPLPYLPLTNRAVTGPPRGKNTLNVDRRAENGHERVVASGIVPAGREAKIYYRSVLDPGAYAGALLRLQLAANGIAVEGETRRGPVAQGATPLWVFDGHSLAEITRLFLKNSNNAIAESLVKALGARASGRPGSWENGIPALREALAAAGVATDGMSIVDGSGLSYDNRVSPRQLVAVLQVADASFRFGPEFEAALPIAAADGTLEKRASEAAGAVRAKTGLLTRVTSLSGYAELADGTQVVFSLIVNGFRSSAERAMDAADAFVAALTAGSAVEPPEAQAAGPADAAQERRSAWAE